MKLQGNVPISAKEVAVSVRSQTGWQKYVVYNVILELAVEFHEPQLNDIPFEPMTNDNHEVSTNFMDSDQVRVFRGNRRAVSNAAFFRSALFQGAQVLQLFLDKGLPEGIPATQVLDCIRRSVGKNDRFSKGLEFFEGHLVSAPN